MMKSCVKNRGVRKSTNPVSTNVELQFYCDLFESLRDNAAGPAGLSLSQASITECAIKLRSAKEYRYDRLTFQSRVAHEGMSFLTMTLPSMGKAIDKALLGDSDAFESIPFKKRKDSKLPLFMGSLTRLVFTDDGCVRSDACTQSLRLLRQLCFLFYKLEVPYANELNQKVLDRFVSTDAELPTQFVLCEVFPRNHNDETEQIKEDDTNEQDRKQLFNTVAEDFKLAGIDPLVCLVNERQAHILGIARYLIGTVLGGVNPRAIEGKHGPGAVATGECGAEKIKFSRIYKRLDRIYPFTGYFQYNLSHILDEYERYDELEELCSGTAKVVLVPKDSRGPRLISCEPLEYQWIQQGQMATLTEAISSAKLTRGHVNFDDQTINQRLAVSGSIDGATATIDMKDASDRVSMALVLELYPTLWAEALYASRTPSTKLPNGKLVHLKKFAPMGSAVCFPVEALCFYALAVAAVYTKRMIRSDGSLSFWGKHRLNVSALRRAAQSIYVYGDDIICNTEDCGIINQVLESFHLKVNRDKSCMTGSFRESCGVDAFKGINVTPVRLKRRWLSSTTLAPETYLAYVAQSNALFAKGYTEAAWVLERAIQKLRPTPYCTLANPPGLAFSRPHLGWHATLTRVPRRYNAALQRMEVRTYLVVPMREHGTDLGWKELLRCESLKATTNRPDLVQLGGEMAGVYAVPRRYKLKRGWMPLC